MLWSSAGPDDAPALVLAPGAGSTMDSPWMTQLCELLAGAGVHTLRFEFAYTSKRRAGGTAAQPRAEAVLPEYVAAVRALDRPVFIGGKSFGGRVASMIADEFAAAEPDTAPRVLGLVCLGYPFHPPGRPDRLRTDHLEALRTPALICQGERDPFGTREEVAGYRLSPAIGFHWAPDGNHDLRPRMASGRTLTGNLADAAAAIAAFIAEHA